MAALSLQTRIKLNHGGSIPILGLGTFQLNTGTETRKAVKIALEAGYRHIDTAEAYGNERDVGEAVHQSGIPREEIFITTKVWNSNHGFKPTINACKASLDRLGVTYLDLYLIHWPVEGLRLETWHAFENLLEEGMCHSIGVSNYTTHHLKELLENSSTLPAINQVEFSPYLYQRNLLEFCRSQSIQLEAYSPLTKGLKLHDPKLLAIAQTYSKSPAQILIR